MSLNITITVQELDVYFYKLTNISEQDAHIKPASNKWSKIEILGHLVDSSIVNISRIVLLQNEDNIKIPEYEQDDWVKTQNYQNRRWEDITILWKSLNLQLLHLVENIDVDKLSNIGYFKNGDTRTLEYFATDYFLHLEHHLKQILL